ncbi:dipeptidyl peptidase IV N-terminal region-domain-containing protein, partial [Jimgerdemannia flammicorona]
MSKASWDHIRRQVRSFRAAVQAQPPATTLATIKDFCFDDDTDRLYFLANDPSKPGNMNKSLMLYEVDLADFDRSHTTDNPTSTSASSQHTPIKRHHLTTIPSEHQVHSTPASLSGPPTSPTSPPFSPSSSASTTNPTDPAFLATIAALPSAPWRPLFSDGWFRDPDKPNAPASREEQLAKERRRVATQGITCYQFDARTGKVLFGYGGNVYVGSVGRTGDYAPYQICPPPSPLPTLLVLAPNSHLPITSHHHPYSRSTPSPPPSDPRPPPPLSPRVDPKLGGRHGDLVAFVRHRDIWVSTLQGRETQLTFCSHKDDGTLSCGVAEFVMQEEFHRFTGYYWAPPSPAHNTDRILYLQVSESMVEVVLIPRPGASGPGTNECEKYRYPRAGTANATSDLQIVEFRVPNEREARPGYGPVHKRLWGRCALQELFPWMEYVVRFGWMPDGGSVWVQLLSRAQERSAVVRIPVECFLSATEYREESVAEEGEKAEGAEEKEEKAGADYVDEAGTVEVDGDGDVMMTTQLGNGSGRENAEGERRRERKERWRAGKIEVLWEEVAETWVN